MACARHGLVICRGLFLAVILLGIPGAPVHGDDAYQFDVESFEKKPWQAGGFAEVQWQHMDVRQGSALARLNLGDDPPATLDDLGARLQLNGAITKGLASIHWLLNAWGEQGSSSGWHDEADIYEGYFSLGSASTLTGSVGKKAYKWGKGYAWNPAGFINRVKDPNNPEEAMEGYSTVDAELIRSFTGDLRTIALSTAMLPVWQGGNEDFGAEDHINLAAKLYLLYLDTDIDFILFTGNSRTTRFGADFSRNLTSNFEIHGELAHIPDQERVLIDQTGGRQRQNRCATSWLAGIRYLTTFDLTSIIEYFHQGTGYSEQEMTWAFQMIEQADGSKAGSRLSGSQFSEGLSPFAPNPGRNYLYARFSQKEPFDLLYWTPAFIAIVNLDDHSSSLTPELIYTGLTNWEIRLRLSLVNGGETSEFGEKQNSNRVELRVRSFF
jgi:hypothetical protein